MLQVDTDKLGIYSKLAALFVLAIVLVSAWMGAARPYLELLQDRLTQAERLQDRQNALRQIIADEKFYQQQFQATSESREFRELFLDDKKGALAEARLQGIINQVVNESGAKLLQAVIAKQKSATSADAPGSESDADDSVTIKVLVQGSIESIYTLLHALENGRPQIVIDNLRIVHQKSRSPVSPEISATSYRASYDATAFIL